MALGRFAVRVDGVVQGVGFRPFVHGLARRLGLTGFVGNDSRGVFVEVEGASDDLNAFVSALRAEAPPLAVVDDVRVTRVPATGASGFEIVASPAGGEAATLVSADSATCADCLAELRDPGDRRYRYPFVNCTNCGPRFTIVRGVPYDRPLTTMAGFALCADCRQEYEDPGDRRFHAQPVCCPVCGPRLVFSGGGEPIESTVDAIGAGAVVAVKGLGGYHLAVDAADEPAVAALRGRKHREDKPFAVMVPDLAAARAIAEVDDVSAAVLTGHRRPIVLLPRVANGPLAPSVAPGNRRIGVMLPYTPLHHLLLCDLGRPIVLTSANVSDEPIVYRDEDAFARLSGIADAFLTHDRAIHTRTDDSVVRVWRDRVQLQRRSRGYVPEPVTLRSRLTEHILGCGAELKNTFCLAKDTHAFLSHHIGDLDNYETFKAYETGIAHFRELFDVTPTVVAHDLHPEYLSTKHALDLEDVELVGVQHHHAHIASCLADNGEAGPVLGVAFDGTGYGTDGTLWGGEFLNADLTGFERLAHLAPIRLPGGATAIRQPWRMAAAYLDAANIRSTALRARHEDQWDGVLHLARTGLASPLTSSAGRLFDAVAAVLGVRDEINYEGQAAVELEQLADPAERAAYRCEQTPTEVSGVDLLRAVVEDLDHGTPRPVVAARFHNGVAEAITETCTRLRDTTALTTVVLSGGVFQNLLLLERTAESLAHQGFRVLTHSRVPTNDGGISLGQVAVAASRTTRPGRHPGSR
ncbi:carbamoyltransferase HypF [Amycolatopsis carbonis]|uniref:Carbamoyltransferase n=1 Tax=Amycolatopsis carbonis TaxID=715471 RepID=A0A9Y2II59_9PSEU|nr:carbamoyltransferase HypF [Amycolatopsis sp. 2-15]WIX80399.1 carbamoyltransferase HypF [Amycolatopsis sp. 2-15]